MEIVLRGPVSFAALMETIYAHRFTGPVTLHFFSGTVTSVDFPQKPVNLRLDTGQKPSDTPG